MIFGPQRREYLFVRSNFYFSLFCVGNNSMETIHRQDNFWKVDILAIGEIYFRLIRVMVPVPRFG
jgi:hypothetical protein